MRYCEECRPRWCPKTQPTHHANCDNCGKLTYLQGLAAEEYIPIVKSSGNADWGQVGFLRKRHEPV